MSKDKIKFLLRLLIILGVVLAAISAYIYLTERSDKPLGWAPEKVVQKFVKTKNV